jgi:tetratricopeptide (TPR) repeat protein
MRRTVAILVVSAVVFAGVQLANAEEELFDTKTATAHVEKGLAHLKDKKYDSAISELEEAVSINPDAEAYYYLGYAYYMQGKKGDTESRKKAIESFDKVYELNPGFTPSRFKSNEAAERTQKVETTETPEPPAPTVTSEPAKPATAPAVPSQPAEPSPERQPDQQTPDNPSQPAPPPPFKATDKVQHLPGY